ncbi:MAG: DUF952 domain-containing protein [SAR324 cluster bacterium]|nr:DUF952 domain-containing protein [SAR324 cluster bacterium]
MKSSGLIYHIAIESEFRRLMINGEYCPPLFKKEGFIHCTELDSTLLKVAKDYFSHVNEAIIVLEINTTAVSAEIKFEAPVPIAGGGREHLETGLLFPHIYGPLNTNAIKGIGRLNKVQGSFTWPKKFISFQNFFFS